MLWAYFNFSQYMLEKYAANLVEEIPYFITRISHGWQYLALFLVLFQFAVPFLLLLMRDLKRTPHRLVWVALALLVLSTSISSCSCRPSSRQPAPTFTCWKASMNPRSS